MSHNKIGTPNVDTRYFRLLPKEQVEEKCQ